ncbi:MAG TPA: Gfo/Idh/MocA family oxidoreductase [Tepidisphaeraceae bacterium]|jgi:predicted dehydrogenase
MHKPVRVGVVGTGAISGAYLGMAKNLPVVEIAACADINREAAAKKAAEFGIARACSVDELMEDDSIEIVLNLTIPKAHVPVGLRAIEAGKHTYAEKPFGVNTDEGAALLAAGRAKGLRTGCAPDTFMGAGIQTARKLIDDGAIGRPIAFTAFMMGRGHEHWHPSPEFYYQAGGGPMFDMGPYYLTALLNLLGPVKRVMGMTSITRPERPITHKNKEGAPGPKFGQIMKVETPDHVLGMMEFENGCCGSIIQSFATRAAAGAGSPIVVYGTDGTLRVPDPNSFDGPVALCRFDDAKPDEFVDVPHTFVKGYGRSVGLADMAYAVRSGRAERCNGEQALTVLELMQGFLDSSRTGTAVTPTPGYKRPAPMPAELPYGTLDA